jgi:high-affinity nickel-transport protein
MLRLGLVVTAFAFGFRHGIDWDHIAAITDITGSQESTRQSVRFATLYAVGHALVVFVLGVAAIALSAELPDSVDAAMGRFVGLTLLVLGVYVFYSLLRHGRSFRMRSRWMLVFAGVRRAYRRLRHGAPEAVVIEHDHEHSAAEVHDHALVPAAAATAAEAHHHGHRHIAPMPDDPFMTYGRATAFVVGMIHGVGAETPTQVLIFATAAGAGGRAAGVGVLVCFIAGLLASNTAVALTSTFGFLNATRNWRAYITLSIVTGTFSLVVGALFLLGRDTLLPTIFGG